MYFNYFLFYFICEYFIVIFEVFISLLFGIIFLLFVAFDIRAIISGTI